MSAKRAKRLVEDLLPELTGKSQRRAASKILRAVQMMPMADILVHVPGRTPTAQARNIGVSRQAFNRWLDGTARPNAKTAQRIADITGIAAAIVRGDQVNHNK